MEQEVMTAHEAILQAELWDGVRWSSERVDFCWPDFWVIAEVDGMAKYEADSVEARRALRRRDHEREYRIGDLGFEVVRFTWEDVLLRPDEVCARIRRAFLRAARRHTTPAEVRTASGPPCERMDHDLAL